MIKIPIFILSLLFGWVIYAQNSVTFVIDQLPENHPQNDPVYIAGSFNSWDPGNATHQLSFDEQYFIKLEGSGSIEFKFARGNWDKVEGGPNGEEIGNRSYSYTSSNDTVYIQIDSWKDLEGSNGGSGNSTKAENVTIIDQFFMPQLNRSRRLWVYLPPNYDQETKSYPVLYLHDGQNLFDNATSFSGEWQVDEALNELFTEEGLEVIAVGIDNGGAQRIDEYSAWENTEYGGGEGEEYARFLVKTLKPYIDENYRTLPDRANTAIMGSSLGALISYYAGLKYDQVFGKIGAPSPAFWFNPEIFDFTDTVSFSNTKIYLSAGGSETATTKSNMNLIYDQLLERNVPEEDLYMEVHPGYGHNEAYWRSIFKEMVLWLLPEEEKVIELSIHDEPTWKIKRSSLWLNTPNDRIYQAAVYDLSGRLLMADTVAHNRPLDLYGLPKGMVIIKLTSDQYFESIKVWIKP